MAPNETSYTTSYPSSILFDPYTSEKLLFTEVRTDGRKDGRKDGAKITGGLVATRDKPGSNLINSHH